MNRSPTARQAPMPGDQLGEFKILHLIGEGAMGKVYEARQLSLQRRVALKVLPVDPEGSDSSALTRFYREARSAAQLNHPNIVPVYGFGAEGSSYYYAMQYVQGRSVQQLLDAGEPLDERRVATWALNVARGLEAAHQEGVVHRDIKPANIMVREDDEAVITDFGLSRLQRVKSITQEGALLGTPVYMAPEQARGEAVDHRVDVYALGATLYQCLSGQLPFNERNLRDLLLAITSKEPRPPSALRPGLSLDLEAIALKCLAKDPARRYASCKELGDDLLRFLRGEVVLARSPGAMERVAAALRRQPLALVFAVALGSLLLANLIGVPWLLRRGPIAAARARLEEARELVGAAVERHREARAALAEALKAQASQAAASGAPAAVGPVTRARIALRGAEEALFPALGPGPSAGPSGAAPEAPGERALALTREALLVAPLDHPLAEEAAALLRELLAAREAVARREGAERLASASARERERLRGEAAGAASTLALETTPPGARVFLYPIREEPESGCWRLDDVQALGVTPLAQPVALEPGEYLVKLHAPDRVETVRPFTLARGAALELAVELPPLAHVPPGFVYVAPGEFQPGGDPDAVRPLLPEPVWVDGFFIGAHEVRVREYVEFLRDLPPAERRAHLPAGELGQLRALEERVEAEDAALDHPIAGVSFESAARYCEWRTAQAQGAVQFRLPTDLEWEKAARGPARRRFPWGSRFDPAAPEPLAHMHRAQAAAGLPTRPCGSHLRDRSIYGVFDLGGNVSEWVLGSFGDNPRYRVLRGGSWARGPEVPRAASREPVDADGFPPIAARVGFRLAFGR